MSDALHVRAAARENDSGLALLAAGHHYSYAALAELAVQVDVSRPVLRNSDPLQTALHLYAFLEAERPLCILPTSATPEQVDASEQRMAGVERDIALMLYTSGSAGHPKGVMLPRSALLASAAASAGRHGWRDDDRWLCCLPLHHIGGLSVLLRSLIDRKTAVLSDGFATEAVAAILHDQKITIVSLVPTMLWRLLEAGHRAPPGLRLVLSGGAALDDALRERARDAGYPVLHSYGMTETASQILVEGRALKGVELRVRGGQLEVRGAMLMRGYLPPYDLPAAIEDGWFRTGDRARLLGDARVEILGRADRTIISGGENIDPHRVETSIRSCAGVKDCLAFGRPHPQWGQELVALVVLDAERSVEELHHALKARLPGPLRPKHLIAVPALPLLDNGKVDLREALALADARIESGNA